LKKTDFFLLAGNDPQIPATKVRITELTNYSEWLSEAWEVVKATRQGQITNAFQRCEILNAIDGSEDHLIKAKASTGLTLLTVTMKVTVAKCRPARMKKT
jgi:hypothetical protein